MLVRWPTVVLVILLLVCVAVLAVIVVGLVIQFCERIFITFVGLSVCATLSGLVAVVTFTF